MDDFYKSFSTNFQDVTKSLNLQGIALDEFKNVLSKSSPVTLDFSKGLEAMSKESGFLASRTLEGLALSVNALDESFQKFFWRNIKRQ